MTVPYAFGAATTAIPLSQLDDNFNTTITLGNTAIQLGNTVTTLNNMTLANVTISSGNVTLTNVTVTTANATTVNTTTLIATTANVTTINATDINVAANVTLNGGTANGVVYLNGSKVLTTGSVMTFDGSTFSLGGGTNGSRFSVRGAGAVGGFDTGAAADGRVEYAYNGTNIFYTGMDSASLMTLMARSGVSLAFGANGSEQMRLTSTGLGIGTSSPSTKLHVSGVNVVSTFQSSGSEVFSGYQTSGGTSYIGARSTSMTFDTGGSERMRLDSSGNLGIGTSSPATKLQVYGTAVATQISIDGTGRYKYFEAYASGTRRFYSGWDETSLAANLTTDGAHPITFSTNATERARIDSSGNLLVGTTNTSASAGSGLKLLPANNGADSPQVAIVTAASTNTTASLSLYSTGAGAYRFYVADGGTIYATSTAITGISDVRLKENIRDLDDGLAAVMALKPRKFDWKAGKGNGINDDRGFIAQEFEQVFPDLVDEWKDPAPEGEEPYKAVRADLIPVLVKALQELKAEFDAYKATHP